MTLLEHAKKQLEGLCVPQKYVADRLSGDFDGSLVTRRNGNSIVYYLSKSRTGPRTMLGKDKMKLIAALEEKAYCIRLARAVSEQRRVLEKVCALLERMPQWERVFLDIPASRRHLIQPCMQQPAMVDWDKWERIGQLGGRRNGPETGLVTVNGEKVRSKSELVIADRFRANGVPYHYESPVRVGDRRQARYVVLHPDFLVMNARTGQQYYWEHLGMLDNPEYCAEWLHRAEVYADNGIIIGKNLIVSAESSAHPLDTGYVDCLIEEFLK